MKEDLKDTDPMPFGKYIGKPLGSVPNSYLLWLWNNNKVYGDLKKYIKNNLDVIQKECREETIKWAKQRSDDYFM